MRTDALLRKYAHTNAPAPEDGWKRLVWMAAELVKRSQKERRTCRSNRRRNLQPRTDKPKNGETRMDENMKLKTKIAALIAQRDTVNKMIRDIQTKLQEKFDLAEKEYDYACYIDGSQWQVRAGRDMEIWQEAVKIAGGDR